MKKLLSVILVVISVCALCFTGCGEEKIKIGIIQYMSHPSLDNCYEGIKTAIDQSGIDCEIEFQTGSGTSADSDCVNFAKNMVASGCDIIIAIATPAAKAAFAATDNTDIPVIFCAVNDPVEAKLVVSQEEPEYLCTGTSDLLDLDAQVDMIKGFQPDVKKIGVLYTASEDNSVSNLKRFKEICAKSNVEVVSTAVQNASDIPSAAEDLAGKVDCINNFTDNNVVNNLKVLLSAAEKHGIPVYGSEEEQVKNGCLASVSIDYVALGKVTGEMAVEVLQGADASKMAVKTIKDASTVVNEDVMQSLDLTYSGTYTAVK